MVVIVVIVQRYYYCMRETNARTTNATTVRDDQSKCALVLTRKKIVRVAASLTVAPLHADLDGGLRTLDGYKK